MRIIKFKAKTVDTGKWIYFLLRELEARKFENGEEMPRFIWSTVCRFTGLKDKSGREIYEDDIVKITNEVGALRGKKVVKWHSSFRQTGFNIGTGKGRTKKEIIGNIHENKEVLNG